VLGVVAAISLVWSGLRCSPRAGRAGGLARLASCLASADDAARWRRVGDAGDLAGFAP